MADGGSLYVRTHPALIRGGFSLVVAQVVWVFVLASFAQAAALLPTPSAVPAVFTCDYLPDPGSDAAYPCGDTPAFVNVTFRLRIGVNDPDGDLANVTIYFDYLDYQNESQPGVSPGSLVQTINATQNGTGPAYVETNWTYTRLGEVNVPPSGSHYWIVIVATDDNGTKSGELDFFFELNVNLNSAPFVTSPPQNPSRISPFITFPDPVVPRAVFDIKVRDPDDDSLSVTWEWGDGTSSTNVTGPSGGGARVITAHDYPPGLIRLNETPRTASFDLFIYVYDGIEGHNTSAGPFEVQFTLVKDELDASTFERPRDVGSLWKIGDLIPMEGSALGTQGDLIEAYFWDFDNRTDSDNDGSPDSDMDAVGNATSHAYPVNGTYTISLWATDGVNKKFCGDPDANVCVDPKSHWTKAQWSVTVRPNKRPTVAMTNQNGSTEDGTVLDATVLDPDGDSMTLMWSFGDGTNGTTTVLGKRLPGDPIREPYNATGSLISHSYPRAGFYNLTVRVTDGESTNETTARVFVSESNLPPSAPLLRLLRANGTAAANGTYLPNETVRLEIVLADPENDALRVRIVWGDGNETVLNVTLSGGNVTGSPEASCALDGLNRTVCLVNHTYLQIGNYTVVLNVTDNRRFVVLNETFEPVDEFSHYVPGTIILFVKRPVEAESEGPWDWWDYSTVAAFLGIPLLLVGRGAIRSYRGRKEE